MKKAIYILLVFCGLSAMASAQDIFSTTDNPFGGNLSDVTISNTTTSRSSSAYRSVRSSSVSSSSQSSGTSFLGGLFSSNKRSSSTFSSSSYSTGSALESYSITSRISSSRTSSASTYTPFSSDVSTLTKSSRPAKVPGGDPIGGFVPLSDAIWLIALFAVAYGLIICRRQRKITKR